MLASSRSVGVLTVLLTVVFVGSATALDQVDAGALPRIGVLVAINTLPLLMVRRHPVAVVLAFSVAYPLWVDHGAGDNPLQSLPTLTAMYAAGAWSSRPLRVRAVALLAPAWMMLAAMLGWWDADLLVLGYVALVFVVIWALGVVVASRQAYALELEAKTVQLEAARSELADRAVAEERGRIARELHDVIAHAMSVITVQAAVGAHLISERPAQAGEALTVIEHTGREALAELRRMLTVLRAPEGSEMPSGPQPGLVDLDRLASQVRETGCVVRIAIEGQPRALPAGLDLAAYRVVQEALTNVAKHAPGARAVVTVRYRPDHIEIEIRNRGRSPSGPIEQGQGLRGMTERVALYEGNLQTTAEPDGFRVTARFPLAVTV